ncbi:MAG: tetratricopeptide repeat protein [Alphaproteobacteria bacterium]|nr:tetratricopeptide repeat protein [Alphaproteobacteria bacterium]MBU1512648.1 tetratricopeptide repeat protein [Alphaproteobacteria bacterium]MBU2095042.1 tetratricopeptide repeat protein [Alphaproteobacteria bacterium]MBU2151839.1 tetratricopeptide repeat protein [Alphaproteobacteria bacterium]MBU2306238.1 tetratricopeptide repeat protein [Alphaproteobacteria bacterium]
MNNDPLDQAKTLLDEGRVDDALAITTPLADHPEPSHRALALHSTALKSLGRLEEALVFDQRATMRFGGSGVAWHNLGATLGDLGHAAESVEAMNRALRLGLDGALSWVVLARSKAGAGDLDGAEQAYQEALKRAPQRDEMAAEYADLVWMRRGDVAEAQVVLDRAAHAGGAHAPLLMTKAQLYQAAGELEKAAELLALAAERLPHEPALVMAAGMAALESGRLDEAERLTLSVETRAPELPGVLNQLAIVYLAQGKADLALEKAKKGLALAPDNQSLWGWAATAARATGDPLYKELYDYEAMVGVYEIETPDGWTSLEAYLADLAVALNKIHVYDQHPSLQSLRHGSQTTNRLTGSSDRAIKAFFKAVDKPIRQHIAGMGEGSDPVRARRTGNYRIEGSWSVRLKPGGFHKDHFHSEGWLSSAFYVETPDSALDTAEKQGWIRFGQPPFKTEPALPAEHFVRPKPGRLVLFPSYMWHGTVPFTTDERRLTIAFDAVPV